ncbi:hypothetical protein HBO10_29275 [Pseudomonas sp. WS 5503]|uniref:hypothetical protein n=1 Tax=Pseudomonas TaxID=286 RepID=UPI001472D81E|nr:MULTISPECIES: hypothetical protein [Pseudomonas]MBM3107309.1 hypothetical protein [Pseudomonas arcuscaelestis]NMX83601.1 hypothetical protein [Pseudomonas sp. WS 5503]
MEKRMHKQLSRLTVPCEGLIWQAACNFFGRIGLEELITELLKKHGTKTHRSSLEYLRLEWIGVDAIEALRAAQEAAKVGWPAFDELPFKVAIWSCYRRYLADSLIQALPVELIPAPVKGLRLELDLGL